MKIWVDADACPAPVKEILVRAAQRCKVVITFVANQAIRLPPSPYLRAIQVGKGFDVADHYIVEQVEPGDMVITQDIPLAAEVIAKDACAMNPRGEHYTKETIGQRLNMRDFMDTMRSSGVMTGGPAAYSQQDRQAFANTLDRWLTANVKSSRT